MATGRRYTPRCRRRTLGASRPARPGDASAPCCIISHPTYSVATHILLGSLLSLHDLEEDVLLGMRLARQGIQRVHRLGHDVATVAPAVLRHRLQLRPEAELERYSPDDAVAAAIRAVAVPR